VGKVAVEPPGGNEDMSGNTDVTRERERRGAEGYEAKSLILF